MLTISTKCSFASYDAVTKKLTSAIISIDDKSSIISGADEPKVNGHVQVCSCVTDLVSALSLLEIKEIDGSDIIDITKII